MNRKQKRKLAEKLKKEYGVGERLFDCYELMQSKDDVWITSRKCLQQDLEGLNIDSMGLQIIRDGKPTIHGIQLLFKGAIFMNLSEEDAKNFIEGGYVGEGQLLGYGGHPIDLKENRIKR